MTHIKKTDIALLLFFILLGFLWIGLRLVHGRFVLPSFYMMCVFFVLSPVAEEFFFRGFLQSWLKKYMSAARFHVSLANVTASILFSMAHMAGWGVEHGLIVFAPSLLIGVLYDRTGRVSFAILLHSIYNLNAIVV